VKKFKKLGAVVLGISPDKPEAQKRFEENQGLGVTLLSDEEKETLTRYGAYGEKKMYGKTVQGVIRSTFLIEPGGKVAYIWKKVRVDGHAEAVLAKLEELAGRG